MNTCPYFCINKTELGCCKTTVCINPKYNCLSVTKWLEKADYVQVVRCKDCRWGREVCGNIECSVDMYEPVEYHGYEWYCPLGERKDDG